MKRFLKVILGLVGAFAVLLVLAAVLLPLIYEEADVKQAIAAKVHEQTGRDLSIDGALDFSVFPWLAVEVNNLHLSNAEGFGDQPFARIGQARVGVALLPLLRKQIAVDEITLNGLELVLTVNARGQNNWDDLADAGDIESTPPAGTEPGIFSSQRIAGLNILDARIEFEDQKTGSHYRLNGFSMHTGPLGEGKPVPLELTALLEDLAAGTRADVELAATAAIDLQTEQYDFVDFELGLLIEAADKSASKQVVRIRAPLLSTNLAAQTLQLETFSLELADLEADGTLSARNILDDPALDGSLTVAAFSPSRLMQALHLEAPRTADPNALQHARFNTSFAGKSSQLKLNDFELELDQSRLTGEISISDFERPKVDFDLSVDEINIDRYLEPASEQSGQDDVAMPREELKGREVQGKLTIGKLQMAGLDFLDVKVGIAIGHGKLRLYPLTADFYSGRYSGDISLDSSGAVPLLSLNEKIDSITFQHLVADLADNESLSGTALGHMRVSGRGANSSEVVRSLNGDLDLTLTEGALEGINIWHEIRRGMALYKGLEPPPAEPNRTVFSRMQVDATVADGVVTTRELVAELPFLTVRGDGAVDLGQSSVDLSLVALVSNAPELANDPVSAELKGRSLPFKVSGSLDAPSVSLDWETLLKSEASKMLLNKLGLGPAAAPEDSAGTDGEQEATSSEDQLKEAAENALFDLLRGKDKDKDKDEEDQ
jgi:AsmA protein